MYQFVWDCFALSKHILRPNQINMDRFLLKTPRTKSTKSKQPRSEEDTSHYGHLEKPQALNQPENSSTLDSGYKQILKGFL